MSETRDPWSFARVETVGTDSHPETEPYPPTDDGTGIRIGVMSDLHIEYEPTFWHETAGRSDRGDRGAAELIRVRREHEREPGHPTAGPDLRGLKAAEIDLLLLAGDIGPGTDGAEYAAAAARYLDCRTVYVAGNHEAWKRDLVANLADIRSICRASGGAVTFLENDRVTFAIGGRTVTILGCTLWTDFRFGDQESASLTAAEMLTDYWVIEYGGHRFTPEIAQALHFASRAWLAREMPRARFEADIVIVMTHYPPLPNTSSPRHGDGLHAASYTSDMTAELANWRSDLCVWGHTHHRMRSRLGRTELVSAPRGFLGLEAGSENFVPVVIEL